jgi:DNA polymerase elongation subunit (family B)
MSEFYTYSKVWGNNILYRGYSNGKQIVEKVPFGPTLYIPSKTEESGWRGLYNNESLEPVEFSDIREAKNFIDTYKDVYGMPIHGFQRFEYQYINHLFPNKVEYTFSDVNIVTIDIETVFIGDEEDEGFPDIEEAKVPVVLISLHSTKDDKTLVYGFKDYTKEESDNFEYVKFSDEKDMLKALLVYFQTTTPDILTGWNIETFDVPYLCNRIANQFDADMVKKLSPFNIVKEKMMEIRGKEVQTYEIYGIVILDYLPLYKKLGARSVKEQYTLGFIAQEELNETKLELPGLSFRDNYENYHQIFVQYNALDSVLVKRMEEKLKLLELTFALAFQYKSNLEDVFKTVLPWETLIFNYLASKKIAVPPRMNIPDGAFEGAYVKQPKQGMYGWTMSFDFSALYSSIMQQWNISPETFVSPDIDLNVDMCLSNSSEYVNAQEIAKERNCTLAANGAMFDKSINGFLPTILKELKANRDAAKNKMLEFEKLYEVNGDKTLVPNISSLNNEQTALKLLGNGVYGAGGNKGFHYYNYKAAEAITLCGQYSNKHLEKSLNVAVNKILGTTDVDYIIYCDTDSVVGDSIVNVNGIDITIADLYDQFNEFAEFNDLKKSYVKVCNNSFVNSVNSNGEIEPKEIRYIMKHRVKKEMFKISFNGKSVIVTEDHAIIVKRDGMYISVNPREILGTDLLINISSQQSVSQYESNLPRV